MIIEWLDRAMFAWFGIYPCIDGYHTDLIKFKTRVDEYQELVIDVYYHEKKLFYFYATEGPRSESNENLRNWYKVYLDDRGRNAIKYT